MLENGVLKGVDEIYAMGNFLTTEKEIQLNCNF